MATVLSVSERLEVEPGVDAHGEPISAPRATILQLDAGLVTPDVTAPVTLGILGSADGARWWRLAMTWLLGVDDGDVVYWGACRYRYYRVVAVSQVAAELWYRVMLDEAYAGLADLAALSIPDHALRDVPESAKLRALLAASDELDGYLNAHYQLPLVSWGHDLRMHCAGLAAAVLMRVRGYSPEAGSDELIRMMRTDALEWAERIANGKLSPPGMVDSTPDVLDAGAIVRSREPRGW